jgi:hypothetical protein
MAFAHVLPKASHRSTRLKKYLILAILIVNLLTSCRAVHQADLDSWIGVPVIAVDTHSFLLPLPMIKTVTDSGVEIRVYSNKRGVSSCGGTGVLSNSNFNSFQACSAGLVGCDGIFYIRDGKVIETKAVGNCYTDESSRPEKGYEKFMQK